MRNRSLIELGAGLAGGLLGTRMMLSLMKRAGKLPPSLRPMPPQKDAGEFMVEHAEALVGELPERLHGALVEGLRWGYGAAWPLLLGALVGKLGLRSPGRRIAAGAALGALVWAIGSIGWMPATGLLPPIHRQPIGGTASNLLAHVAYGALASLPLAALEQPTIKERIA